MGVKGAKFDYNWLKRGVSTNVPMEIVVNGQPRSAEQGQTILDLLRDLELDPARVAVEYDRRIVKMPLWPDTILRPGAQVEIVQFVGGG